jgi:hypothetical protein
MNDLLSAVKVRVARVRHVDTHAHITPPHVDDVARVSHPLPFFRPNI